MKRRLVVATASVALVLAPTVVRAADGDPLSGFGTNGRVVLASAPGGRVSGLVAFTDVTYVAQPIAVDVVSAGSHRACTGDCELFPGTPTMAYIVDGGERVYYRTATGVDRLALERPGERITDVQAATASGNAFFVTSGPLGQPATMALSYGTPLGVVPLVDTGGAPIAPGRAEGLPGGRFAVASTRASAASVGAPGLVDTDLEIHWFRADATPDTTRPDATAVTVRVHPDQTARVLAAMASATGGLDVVVGAFSSAENADGWPTTVTVERFAADGSHAGTLAVNTARWSPVVADLPGHAVVLVGRSSQLGLEPPPADIVARIDPDGPTPVTVRTFDGGLTGGLHAVADATGRLVVAAPGTSVVRLTPTDVPDATFGANGTVAVDGAPSVLPTARVGIAPDGTVLVASPQVDGTVAVDAFGGTTPPAVRDRFFLGTDASSPDSRFVPVTPTRVLDTRVHGGGRLVAGETRAVDLGAVVPAGATGVAVNLTVTESDGGGYARLGTPAPGAPETSTVNVARAGETAANSTVVPVDGATVPLYSSTGAHYVLDVTGYFLPAATTAGGRLHAISPTRVFDTRLTLIDRLQAGDTATVAVRGVGGMPVDHVSAVAVTVTTADPLASGFVTVWPTGTDRPLASLLNPAGPRDIRSNLALVPVGADGTISVYTHSASHVIVDVVGWFDDETAPLTSAGTIVMVPPTRVTDTRLPPSAGPLPAGEAVTVATGGDGASYASALTNVTVTGTADAGFVTAYPVGGSPPLASTVTFDRANQDRAAMAVTAVTGGDGAFRVYGNVTTDVVVDVLGFVRA